MKNSEQSSGFVWLLVAWTGLLLLSGTLALGVFGSSFSLREGSEEAYRPNVALTYLAIVSLFLIGIGLARLLRLRRIKRLSLDRATIAIAMLAASLFLCAVSGIMWGYEISLQGDNSLSLCTEPYNPDIHPKRIFWAPTFCDESVIQAVEAMLWRRLFFWNGIVFLGSLAYLVSRDREDVRMKLKRFSESSFTEDRLRLASLVLLWMGVSMIAGILLLIEFGPVFGRVEKERVGVIVSGEERVIPHETRKFALFASLALIGTGGLVMGLLSAWEKRWFDKKKIVPAIIVASVILSFICFVFWLNNHLKAHNPGVEWPSGDNHFFSCGTYLVNKELKIVGPATLRYIFWFRLLLWNLALFALGLILRSKARHRSGKPDALQS